MTQAMQPYSVLTSRATPNPSPQVCKNNEIIKQSYTEP